MKKPGRAPGAGKPSLSDDDRAVWALAAETTEPLKRAKGRVHPAAEALGEAEGRKAPPAARAPHEKPAAPSKTAATAAKSPPAPKPPAVPPLGDVTPNDARKLRSGRIEIEARIDLHGMRQGEAHTALRRFIGSCHARGLKWVLVITGKGAPQRRGVDAAFEERETGVLRRNVPRWLAEPDLRAMVVGYKTAAIRHGGEGAIYVQVRRRGMLSD